MEYDWLKKKYHHNKNKILYYHELNIIMCILTVFALFICGETETEILICAQTQSGKSEAMNRILEIIEYNKRKLQYLGCYFNKVFIIICASCKELKDDITNKTYDFNVTVLHIDDIQRILKKKLRLNDKLLLNNMKENCLLIFDESHAVSEYRQTIAKFRTELGITAGNFTNKSVKVVTLSATPYEQILMGMEKVILKPGKEYYGIHHMLEEDRIKQCLDLEKYSNVETLFNGEIKENFLPRKYVF